MVFQVLGLLILILFYGIYFGKMFAQRRKGIRTDQMAKGNKRGKVFWIELLLKAATYMIVFVEAVSLEFDYNAAPTAVRCLGALIGFMGVLCFGISVYTMRDSWRAGIPEKDKTEFVTTGIYAFSRNPAFLGFDLTYTGILLMFFNSMLFVSTCIVIVMLHLQILQEETYLSGIFGKSYDEYKKHVGRYLGRRF